MATVTKKELMEGAVLPSWRTIFTPKDMDPRPGAVHYFAGDKMTNIVQSLNERVAALEHPQKDPLEGSITQDAETGEITKVCRFMGHPLTNMMSEWLWHPEFLHGRRNRLAAYVNVNGCLPPSTQFDDPQVGRPEEEFTYNIDGPGPDGCALTASEMDAQSAQHRKDLETREVPDLHKEATLNDIARECEEAWEGLL